MVTVSDKCYVKDSLIIYCGLQKKSDARKRVYLPPNLTFTQSTHKEDFV